MAMYPFPNSAGSRFPMQGGTLAQLAVQPQRRMLGTAPASPTMAGATGFQGPISSTASPGFPGATIPTGTTFDAFNSQASAPAAAPASLMAQPAAPMADNRNEWLANTPGYQFRFDQGQQAIERSAAARGTALTGGTLKELARFGSGLASQEFGAEADRLARLTQLGQSGAQQLGNYGTGYGAINAGLAETGANNAIGLGNAQAGGTLAGVNASNAMGSQIANNLGQIDWAKLFGRQPAATAPQSGLSARNFAGAMPTVNG